MAKTNYYRLSGYYLPFIRKETEKCFFSLKFERIQNIYAFDAELRNLISFVIEKIETHVRTQLAYFHAHTYGAEGYMDSSSFNQKHNHDSYTKPYFYRGMKNRDKAQIAESMYGVNYQIMDSWLRCLTDLRNRCAHYSRLYYWIFPAIPKMPSKEKYVPTRRLFAQIYMLKLMYPDKEKWNEEFVTPLTKLIKKYKADISLKYLDFPYRWKSMLKQ